MGTLAMNVGARAPRQLRHTAYRASQFGMLYQCLAGHQLLRTLLGMRAKPSDDALAEVQTRFRALLDRDLRNVNDGLYPAELLFQFPFVGYLKAAPLLARDLPRTIRRMRAHDFEDLPREVDLERYPAYFRRNFHWQTDGYFSKRSAAIYDVAVEFLFLGTADVMRRQVIPPVSRMVRQRGNDLRVLDVACGTGRTLLQLALAHPRLRYYGLDLSPYYLQYARELLADVEDISLVAENAERMPFKEGFFDVVTSVHLFHELPRDARRNVYREMFRVLRPGGTVVIQDSAQLSDSGELAFFLGRFSREFHEPYHRDYSADDIAEALCEVGFEPARTEAHFVAKVVEARKPERARRVG
jgi:ubiquinone/menaquinone biosynthesis C-methylase UbiE